MIHPRPRTAAPRLVVFHITAILVAYAAAGALGCRQASMPEPFEAERLDVRIDVHADGSIDVRERIEGLVADGSRSFVRLVESPRADTIVVQSVMLDGLAMPVESANLRLSETPRGVRAEWLLEAGDRAGHVFELHYRATGALSVDDNRGRLVWPVLPGGAGFAVREATVLLQVDAPGEILRGTGMAEAGWTVVLVARGLKATRADVGRDPATLLAEVSVDTQVVTLPAWQVRADLRSEFSLAFVSGALFVLVIGAGVIVIVRAQHPRRGRAETRVADPERDYAVAGLRKTATIGGLFSIVCAIAAYLTLSRFGWWAQLIPASMLLVSLAFGLYAQWMRRRP
jgi:hypothetical protein